MKDCIAIFALLIILTICLVLSAQLVQKGVNLSPYIELLALFWVGTLAVLLKRLSE